MQANLQLAALLATQIPVPTDHPRWVLQTVSNLKLRAFIPPGATLELEAKVTEQSVAAAALAVETRMGGRVVGGARVLLVPEKPS
jgi:3-hydroxymyristoyl/3-hydroxydecanoyl-(acyl carrier protein) dehydratase